MGVLGFENRGGNGSGNNWNYSDPNKEGYMLQLQGTVVEIKEVPATKFNSNEIDRWPDGNPKLNIALVIQGQSGRELEWVFSPGGIQRPTQAMAACRSALQAAGKPAESVAELGGLFISVATQEAPQGFSYGAQNPRPWAVQVLGQGQVPFRGVHEYTEQANVAQQQPQAAAPTQQPAPVAQPVQPVQPVAQQAAPAPVAQPAQPVAPAPAPVPETPYYEQDIPF